MSGATRRSGHSGGVVQTAAGSIAGVPDADAATLGIRELVRDLLADVTVSSLFVRARQLLDAQLSLTPVERPALDIPALLAALQHPLAGLATVAEPVLLEKLGPLLATEGACLAGLAAPTLAGTAYACTLWPLYRDALRHRQAVGTHGLLASTRDPTRVQPELMPLAVQLALGRFVFAYLPEVLGYSLGYAAVLATLSRAVPTLDAALSGSPFGNAEAPQTIVRAIEMYFSACRSDNRLGEWSQVRQRCQRGAWLARRLVEDLISVSQPARDPREGSPRGQMLQLLWRKLPYARGQHRDCRLGGKRLEEWFGQPEQLGELLDALAGSAWVDHAQPARSRLLTELLAFRGPMFQVFTAEELALVNRWLASLRNADDEAMPVIHVDRSQPAVPAPAVAVSTPHPGKASGRQVRALFAALIDYENQPDVLAEVSARIPVWLGRATRMARWRGEFRGATGRYSETGFRARIEAIYHAAVSGYRPLRGRPWLRREEYRWLLLQLAPLFLVDGCWLQRVGPLLYGQAAVVPGLLDILTDELGDGKVGEHHANIFRELLASEDLGLPDLRSVEFSRTTAIASCSFELPVFMLALSLHARARLPELLGLNLAIELSGLGGFYLRLVDELRYYGFDPTIISLHLSIDNLASGHAAIARDLIPLYLSQLQLQCGEEEMHRHWQRIWSGYLSLGYYSQRLLLGLLPAFVRRFGRERWQLLFR